MIQKGKVSTVLSDGKYVTATPDAGDIVTVQLVVPSPLIGILPVGTPIVYVTFADGTGLVIARADGVWGESNGGAK